MFLRLSVVCSFQEETGVECCCDERESAVRLTVADGRESSVRLTVADGRESSVRLSVVVVVDEGESACET